MNTALIATAALMGFAGGPHCMAMCGASCGAITGTSASRAWLFHLGRLLSYTLLGLVAATSFAGVGWLSIQVKALRPLWSMIHVVAIVIGLMLLIRAKQPLIFETFAKRVWQQANTRHSLTPLGMGLAWAFMPCGLLYSAVLVASLTAEPLEGAIAMLAFALGGSIFLVLGSALWFRLKSIDRSGQWSVRAAGFALAASSGWGFWMGLAHNQAPWCVV